MITQPHRNPLALATVLAAALLCAAACDSSPPAEPVPEAPAQPPPRSEGHQRMVDLLARVAEESRADNPFLGRDPIDRLRADLAGLTPGVPDLRRWLYTRLLGKHLLRLGQTEEAIESYLAAQRELEVFPDEIPLEERLGTIFDLGVAWLRLGETRNCAARHNAESCILPIRGGGVHVEPEGSRKAIECFDRVLAGGPPDTALAMKARWLLNVAHMTLGTWPDGVAEPWRIPPSAFESEEPFPRFVNVANEAGLAVFDLAGGAIAEDFDRDGDLDLLVSTSDTAGPMHYFRNDGPGGFVDRTVAAGLGGLTGGLNMVQADYDNDGWTDVLVLRGGWWRDRGRHPNSLLRNVGGTTFADVTFEAGLGEVHYPTQTAAWADYDNDGDLDLYVGNETDRSLEAPGQLFRNAGDGTFADVAAAAGVTNDRYAKSVSWGDYDGDRFPDLYVSNDHAPNRLYRNLGDGTFRDVAEEVGVTKPLASFPAWFWDFDNDGALDLFVSSYGGERLPPEVAAVAASYLGFGHPAEMPKLYRGDGKGGFRDVAAERGLRRLSLPMGSNFGDADNDGWLDFYLGTGYPLYEGLMPNVLHRNVGGQRFADVTTAAGVGHLQKGHGVVFADLDHDGDQDLFEQIGGAYTGDAFGNVLFRNPGNGNHWLKVELTGTRSNRSAIGARIRLVVREGSGERSIYKHVNSGATFGGNPLRQELGLGTATVVERLEVFWPTTGATQVLESVPADRAIGIVEGREGYETRPLVPFALGR